MFGVIDRIEQYQELEGFDIDLTGFHCASELPYFMRQWRCPFDPGCGARSADQCPLMKRLAMVVRAPRRRQ